MYLLLDLDLLEVSVAIHLNIDGLDSLFKCDAVVSITCRGRCVGSWNNSTYSFKKICMPVGAVLKDSLIFMCMQIIKISWPYLISFVISVNEVLCNY